MAGALVQRLHRVWASGTPLSRAFATPPVARLEAGPPSFRPADPARTTDIYAGRLHLAGRTVTLDGGMPFDMGPEDDSSIDRAWLAALHGFAWLRHLDAAGTPLARSHGVALVADWLARHGRGPGKGQGRGRGRGLRETVWRIDVVAARLTAWIRHGDLLRAGSSLAEAPEALHESLRRAVARHIRFLSRTGPAAGEHLARLDASLAVALAHVCCGAPARTIRTAFARLDRDLVRQIDADGVHMSRRPDATLILLDNLLGLRKACAERSLGPPDGLYGTIDRIADALATLRHGDGRLARFNGTGACDPVWLQALLREAVATPDPAGAAAMAPQGLAAVGGYRRACAQKTALIMDCGVPTGLQARRTAHAAPLAFEMSSDGAAVIVNCGTPPRNRARYRPFCAATAAHSTAVLGERSVAAPVTGWKTRLIGPAIPPSPWSVEDDMSVEADYLILHGRHDGYVEPFGAVHERRLMLARDGSAVNGIDRFLPVQGAEGPALKDRAVALRFHLAPGLTATPLSSGQRLLISGAGEVSWVFTCVDAPIEATESVAFFVDEGPTRIVQIVVHGSTDPGGDGRGSEVRWVMERQAVKSRRPRRSEGRETHTPFGDLLSPLETVPDTSDV